MAGGAGEAADKGADCCCETPEGAAALRAALSWPTGVAAGVGAAVIAGGSFRPTSKSTSFCVASLLRGGSAGSFRSMATALRLSPRSSRLSLELVPLGPVFRWTSRAARAVTGVVDSPLFSGPVCRNTRPPPPLLAGAPASFLSWTGVPPLRRVCLLPDAAGGGDDSLKTAGAAQDCTVTHVSNPG